MRRPVQPTLRRSQIVRKASPDAVVSPLHWCSRQTGLRAHGGGTGHTPADAVRCERGELYPGVDGELLPVALTGVAVLAANSPDGR